MDAGGWGPAASWGTIIAVGGGLAWYYGVGTRYIMRHIQPGQATSSNKQQFGESRKRQTKDTGRRKEPVARTASPAVNTPPTKAETPSANTSTSNKKRKPGKGPAPRQAGTPEPASRQAAQDDEEEDEDTQTWAKELQAKQSGISLDKPSSRAANQQKSRSPAKAVKNAEETVTTNGTGPSETEQSRSAGDISDMLKAPKAGPSIMRITGEEEKKKQQAPKAAPAKETKKQRQNRRKVEERSAQRDADEKARQTLLETQRRIAREGRGEAAKNGLGIAQAPSSSAWAQTNGNSVPAPTPQIVANDTQLLDTFDPDAASTTSSNEAATNSTTPATAASTSDLEKLPSEEAQLEMLNEMRGWNEVSTKKQKRKGKAATPTTPPSDAGSKASNTVGGLGTSDLVNGTSRASTPVSKQPPIMKPKNKEAMNGYAALSSMVENPASSPAPAVQAPQAPVVKGHPQDSEWAA